MTNKTKDTRLLTNVQALLNTVKATWLCFKYPFLYPRNRFTGLHYNNWRILQYLKELASKYKRYKVGQCPQDKVFYLEVSGKVYKYWTNWWAKPLYDVIDWYHGNILQWFHCMTKYTELDTLPATWVKDFGEAWAKELHQYLKANNIKGYRICQLKEKWGEFDWLYPPDFEGALAIEQKYIKRSRSICICCGAPATRVSTGWISYYCDKCAPPFTESINNKNV